MLHSYYWLMEK